MISDQTALQLCDVIRETDKETILALCEKAGVKVIDRGEKSIQFAGRRFYFNEKGQLDKILDYEENLTALPDKVKDTYMGVKR